jgi:rhamnulokinase
MATGAVRDLAHARKIIRASFPVTTYEPQNPAAWEAAYERYLDVL